MCQIQRCVTVIWHELQRSVEGGSRLFGCALREPYYALRICQVCLQVNRGIRPAILGCFIYCPISPLPLAADMMDRGNVEPSFTPFSV